MSFLEKFTSSPRVAGNNSDYFAQKLIQEELKKIGKESYLQKFPFRAWENKSQKVFFDEKKIESIIVPWSGSGNKKGKAKKSGIEKTFDGAYEFEKYSVGDNAYLISRPDRVWMQPLNEPDEKNTYAMIYPKDLLKVKKNQIKEVELQIENKFFDSESSNIICESENPEILITAHYDSVPNSPGVNDNASGVFTLLKILEKIENKNIDFIFFGAEEWNLAGSKFWAKVNKIKYKFAINIDMIASSVGEINIFAEGGNNFEKIKKINLNYPLCNKIGSQWDSSSILKSEIPVINIGCYPYPQCHFENDNLENIDLEKIDEVANLTQNLIKNLE